MKFTDILILLSCSVFLITWITVIIYFLHKKVKEKQYDLDYVTLHTFTLDCNTHIIYEYEIGDDYTYPNLCVGKYKPEDEFYAGFIEGYNYEWNIDGIGKVRLTDKQISRIRHVK